MTKSEMIDLLNSDLSNEYKHMHFYLHSSFMIEGLHRAELGEFLREQSESEFQHVQQFAKMIVGLGGIPTTTFKSFPTLTSPLEILRYALSMEREVLENYIVRQKQALELGGVDGAYIDNFFDEQILDSRSDADELKQLIGKEFPAPIPYPDVHAQCPRCKYHYNDCVCHKYPEEDHAD